MERTKVIDKIQKLMRLSKSANEHEAARAAAAAQALMSKFEIEEAQVLAENPGEADEPVEDDVPLASWGRTRVSWKGLIAGGFGRANGIKVYWNGGSMSAIGRRSDVNATAYMTGLVIREVEKLAKRAAVDNNVVGTYHSRRWLNSFKLGAATVIRERLVQEAVKRSTARRAEAVATGTTQALAVIDKRAERVREIERRHSFSNVRLGGPGSSSGYYAGRSAGANVGFGGRAAGALGAGTGQLR